MPEAHQIELTHEPCHIPMLNVAKQPVKDAPGIIRGAPDQNVRAPVNRKSRGIGVVASPLRFCSYCLPLPVRALGLCILRPIACRSLHARVERGRAGLRPRHRRGACSIEDRLQGFGRRCRSRWPMSAIAWQKVRCWRASTAASSRRRSRAPRRQSSRARPICRRRRPVLTRPRPITPMPRASTNGGKSSRRPISHRSKRRKLRKPPKMRCGRCRVWPKRRCGRAGGHQRRQGAACSCKGRRSTFTP